MKKAHEVDQIALLKDIWQTFRQHFEEEENGVSPHAARRTLKP